MIFYVISRCSDFYKRESRQEDGRIEFSIEQVFYDNVGTVSKPCIPLKDICGCTKRCMDVDEARTSVKVCMYVF